MGHIETPRNGRSYGRSYGVQIAGALCDRITKVCQLIAKKRNCLKAKAIETQLLVGEWNKKGIESLYQKLIDTL